MSFVILQGSYISVYYSHAILTFSIKLSCVYYGLVKVTLSFKSNFKLKEGEKQFTTL